MRIYAAQDEENIRTLELLKDWTSEGFLSEEQHLTMKQDVPCGLRRTNIFLRFVFFLFTMISAGAAVGLFFAVFSPRESRDAGISLVFFAVLCYWGAEILVSQRRLYRRGVEEALVVLSVLFLCVGVALTLFSRSANSGAESIVPGCGVVASLLIYWRFGYQYAFLAAMIGVAFMPMFWTDSHTVQHLFIAGVYTAGLVAVIEARRTHRFDFVDDGYAITEALLWAGIYVAINLQLGSVKAVRGLTVADSGEFSRKSFYWATYVLIWCIPVVMIWRGLNGKDRIVARVGVVVALLTLITNKPYLGRTSHAWDPMLLGILLMGTAVGVKRWLAGGEGGVRRGFTARRFSAKDKQLQSVMSVPASVFANSAIAAHTPSAEPTFSGGDSGGGGASSDY